MVVELTCVVSVCEETALQEQLANSAKLTMMLLGRMALVNKKKEM